MEFPTEIGQLGQNLQNFLMVKGAALPEFTRTKVIEAVGSASPVDRIVKAAEALYAAKAELDDEGKTICAQLAQFAAVNGWHGMAEENRGGRIAQAMQRDLGEKAPVGKWPAADTDPDADAQFIENAAEPETAQEADPEPPAS